MLTLNPHTLDLTHLFLSLPLLSTLVLFFVLILLSLFSPIPVAIALPPASGLLISICLEEVLLYDEKQQH